MPARRPHSLNFPEIARAIASDGEETLYQSARRSGVRLVGACGGRGACGTCVVHIVEGAVELEGGQAEADGEGGTGGGAGAGTRKKWVRACRARARSDCTVEVAPRSLAPVARAEVGAADGEDRLPLDPAVVGQDVSVPEATLSDTLSDVDRIARALARPLDAVDLQAAIRLPQVMRDGGWSLRVFRRGRELIGVAPAGSRTLGLAVDLGTTNAAGFLVDLESGARLASLASRTRRWPGAPT